MYCIKCGKNIPDDARFCPNCGTSSEPTQVSKEQNAPPPISQYDQSIQPRQNQSNQPEQPNQLKQPNNPQPRLQKNNNKKAKPIYLTWWFWVIIAFIWVIILGLFPTDKKGVNNTDGEASVAAAFDNIDTELNATSAPIPSQTLTTEVKFEFAHEIECNKDDGTIILSGTTNAPDGTLLQVTIHGVSLANEFKDTLTVKDKKASTTFTLEDPSIIGGLVASIMLKFNEEGIKQPQAAHDFYGQNGMNLIDNNDTKLIRTKDDELGKNAFININFDYPDKEAAKALNIDRFQEKFQELIVDTSKGVIIGIQAPIDNNWSVAYVTISDDWYNTPEHEKERFAETVGETIEKLVLDYKLASNTMVYFVDTYGKELAKPKLFGGYDIKR